MSSVTCTLETIKMAVRKNGEEKPGNVEPKAVSGLELWRQSHAPPSQSHTSPSTVTAEMSHFGAAGTGGTRLPGSTWDLPAILFSPVCTHFVYLMWCI